MFAVIETDTLPVLKDQVGGMCVYVTESLCGCIANGEAFKYWNHMCWKYGREEDETRNISSGEVVFTGSFLECCKYIQVYSLIGE